MRFRPALSLTVVLLLFAQEAGGFERYAFDWRYKLPDALPMADAFEICLGDVSAVAAVTIREAASRWSYGKFAFTFVPDGCSSSSQFPVQNGVNQIDFGLTEQDAPGVTRPYFDGNNMLECDIRFHMPLAIDFKWNLDARRSTAPDEWDLLTVAMHEFGHCLGLKDEADLPTVVMFNRLSLGQERRELKSDDLSGRAAIYGK